jgi:hypothetical protein
MHRAFERYWDYAQYVTAWTNSMLSPPQPHAIEVLTAAAEHPEVARRFANGVDNPPDFFSWFMDAELGHEYLDGLAPSD